MDTLLSIDLGTTGCKGAVFSIDGRLLGSHYVEYPLIHCGPGCVEQDPADWWSLSVRVARSAVEASGLGGAPVRAIGISTQGISFVPIDRCGEVLRNAMCWLDSRAAVEAEQVADLFPEEELFALTGKRPGAVYVLPKLLWLQKHEPDVCRATHKYLMAHDFLVYRMCGATSTDYSMAGGSMLLDVRQLCWCEPLLDRLGIPRQKLPDLSWSGSIAGELAAGAAEELGLRRGTPVVVGGQDQKCAALGAAIRPGVATVSLGTASAISLVTSRPILDKLRRIPLFPFVLPGQWDLEGVVGTSGAALRWLRETLRYGGSYEDLVALAEASPRGAGGVLFRPHLEGAASPWWNATSRGSFSGITLSTTVGDMVRSMLEGVAYEIQANLDVLRSLGSVEEVVVFGGGARSSLWTRIIAEVSGLPTRVARMVDVANWGACVLAGRGVGIVQDPVADRTSQMMSSPTVPEMAAVREYSGLYEQYVSTGAWLVANGGERPG